MDNQTPPNLQQLGSRFQSGSSQPLPESQPVADSAAGAVDANTIFSQMAKKIIEQQEVVIGPIALEQAKQIQGLTIDWPQRSVEITGDPSQVINKLVATYKELFGQIAVQVSKDAVAGILPQLPPHQQPQSLVE
jgi:hypothetical protein